VEQHEGNSNDDIVLAMVDRLAPHAHTTVTGILRRAEEIYGKPLYLQAFPAGRLKGLTGLFRDTPEGGYISYRQDDPVTYQLHCICHELAHVVFVHEDCHVARESAVSGEVTDALNTLVIRGRGAVTDPEELVAEDFAYRLMQRLLRTELSEEDGIFG
jgi:hypothetical protein